MDDVVSLIHKTCDMLSKFAIRYQSFNDIRASNEFPVDKQLGERLPLVHFLHTCIADVITTKQKNIQNNIPSLTL